jgi:metallo-beta-lactamase family protein
MKKENKLKISFIGGNSYDVTGSMILVEWNKRKILLDCGLIQGGTTLQDYRDNKNMLTKNKLKNIEYIIVGERHIDHIGNIPYITKTNYDCKVITPAKTKKIFKHMLEDSANIADRDCEMLAKKYKDKVFIPSYTIEDVEHCINQIQELTVGEKIKIDDDITIKFSYSGHIFGACQTELWINVNGKIKHFLYTADLGNILNYKNRPFTEELDRVNNATIVISESTYGKLDKFICTEKIIEKDIEKLYSTIEQYTIDKKNRVLIPTFSLDRTPAMLYLIWKKYKDDERFKDVKVIIDSQLSNKLLDVYINELDDEKAE